ncbi:MAG: hypothetical protein DIU80_002525 [Chloroflexota bacterium]
MNDFSLSREDYRRLRQELMVLANQLLVSTDDEAARRLKNIFEFLHTYCAVCGVQLGRFRRARCPRCRAEQPWAKN